MINNNRYEQYKIQGIMTASAGELVLMLYDGCIKNLKLSKMYINDHDIEKANHSNIKAQNIINELITGLDFKFDIAKQLYQLYEYMNWELVSANIKKDETKIQVVIDIMEDLKVTWVQVLKMNKGNVNPPHNSNAEKPENTVNPLQGRSYGYR